jgi:hypothetical protein
MLMLKVLQFQRLGSMMVASAVVVSKPLWISYRFSERGLGNMTGGALPANPESQPLHDIKGYCAGGSSGFKQPVPIAAAGPVSHTLVLLKPSSDAPSSSPGS